jgi:hypothetical protein
MTLEPNTRLLLRADGTSEVLPSRLTIREIETLIGATILDSLNLTFDDDRRVELVMCLDDLGMKKGLPFNEEATKLYHARCLPGTTHRIRGDVVIAPDADFAPPY